MGREEGSKGRGQGKGDVRKDLEERDVGKRAGRGRREGFEGKGMTKGVEEERKEDNSQSENIRNVNVRASPSPLYSGTSDESFASQPAPPLPDMRTMNM